MNIGQICFRDENEDLINCAGMIRDENNDTNEICH